MQLQNFLILFLPGLSETWFKFLYKICASTHIQTLYNILSDSKLYKHTNLKKKKHLQFSVTVKLLYTPLIKHLNILIQVANSIKTILIRKELKSYMFDCWVSLQVIQREIFTYWLRKKIMKPKIFKKKKIARTKFLLIRVRIYIQNYLTFFSKNLRCLFTKCKLLQNNCKIFKKFIHWSSVNSHIEIPLKQII